LQLLELSKEIAKFQFCDLHFEVCTAELRLQIWKLRIRILRFKFCDIHLEFCKATKQQNRLVIVNSKFRKATRQQNIIVMAITGIEEQDWKISVF
jgi:hypothetical protein